MSIRTQDLYDRKLRAFGMLSSAERFKSVFLDACESVDSDLQNYCHTSAQSIGSLEDNWSLDAKFYTVISDGLDLYIQDAGEYEIKNKRDVERRYFEKLATLQVDYFEDEDNDVHIGLGDLSE